MHRLRNYKIQQAISLTENEDFDDIIPPSSADTVAISSVSLDHEENNTTYDTSSVLFSSITFKHRNQIILNQITGCFKSSRLCAIIGPSGAGKSSLLHILAGRMRATSGHMAINNRPISTSSSSLSSLPESDTGLR